MGEGEKQPPRVVETASGTTDANNGKSGGFAYVIAVVAIVVSLGVGNGLRGCVNLMADMGTNYVSQHGDIQTLIDDDGTGDRDWWLDDGFGEDRGNEERTDTDSSAAVSVEELIGGDLNMFSYTIDAHLGASAYANAQQSVSTFARELVVCDRDASSDIATTLRNAAWGSGKLSDAFGEASKKASETIEALRAMEVPEVGGKHADSIASDLKDAREDAIERWEAISDELALLARSERLSADDISDYERNVAKATDDAAEELADALKDSADR